MNRLLLAAILLAALSAPSAAQPVADRFPRVVYGATALTHEPFAGLTHEPPAGLIGATLSVTGELAQIELGPEVTLSLGAGAKLAILRPADARGRFLVLVQREPVLAVHGGHDRIASLRSGSHLITADANHAQGSAADWAVPLAAAEGQAMPGLSSRGLQLGDWVMVRQQAYLDSLRIDVTPINQAIASFIRRLLAGGGR